ncbi:MAG TPA: porin family protein [Cyclobacteriaceae bacterium]|nr:porin family protein [Cyclobacteriaceae bacterium]
MNLKVTLIFACCIITSALQAQKINLEFLGGPNVSMMYGNFGYHDVNSKAGLTSGLGLSYMLKEHLSLSVKGLFERKGCTGRYSVYYDYNGDIAASSPFKYKFRFISNYLTLPITVQYTRGRRIKYTGEAGVFTGVLIRETYKTNQTNGPNFETTNVTNTSKRMDAGVSLGFRTAFPIAKKININVVLLDNLGLLNTSKNGTVRTNAFNILTGLSFSL